MRCPHITTVLALFAWNVDRLCPSHCHSLCVLKLQANVRRHWIKCSCFWFTYRKTNFHSCKQLFTNAHNCVSSSYAPVVIDMRWSACHWKRKMFQYWRPHLQQNRGRTSSISTAATTLMHRSTTTSIMWLLQSLCQQIHSFQLQRAINHNAPNLRHQHEWRREIWNLVIILKKRCCWYDLQESHLLRLRIFLQVARPIELLGMMMTVQIHRAL